VRAVEQNVAVGADMRFPDEQIPPGEEWYYEIDGRAHGPLAWSSLEDMLGRSGETASQVRIRKGADGPWSAFRRGAQYCPASVPCDTAAERFEQSPAARPVRADRWGGIASFLQQHRDLSVAAGVWILVNVLFLAYWPGPYAKERRYLAMLQDVVNEVDDLRASGAADKEWATLAKTSRQKLAPMIADLQKSASSSELPRQQLLWSARDLAPKIMRAQTNERDQNELRMKQYLRSVEQAIGRP
jgi:hypothetical protein